MEKNSSRTRWSWPPLLAGSASVIIHYEHRISLLHAKSPVLSLLHKGPHAKQTIFKEFRCKVIYSNESDKHNTVGSYIYSTEHVLIVLHVFTSYLCCERKPSLLYACKLHEMSLRSEKYKLYENDFELIMTL